MPRQKREKSGTGICHVMQGKESKTCPYDSSSKRSDFLRFYLYLCHVIDDFACLELQH